MIWQNPAYLWLLLVLPALMGGIWWYRRYIQHKRSDFFSSELFKNLRSGFWSTGKTLHNGAFYTGLFFLVIAISGPKVGTEVREVKRQGVDLLVALDLSASMNAEDVKPSRLRKAKYEISRLVDRLKGDRVGLIIFTGDAYLQAPMTLDYSALRMFLNIADTDQMPNSSTDFSAAMSTALEAFDSNEENNATKAAKVLLIISDGENHGDSYDSALDGLREKNISVYTLGIGTQSGTNIPLYDDSGSLIGHKRDESGKVVTTTLEPEALKNIAGEGNGRYYEIQSGSEGIDSFLGRLDELQQGEFASQEYADFKNQYQWMAGVGLTFLFISFLLPNYRRKEEKLQKKKGKFLF